MALKDWVALMDWVALKDWVALRNWVALHGWLGSFTTVLTTTHYLRSCFEEGVVVRDEVFVSEAGP